MHAKHKIILPEKERQEDKEKRHKSQSAELERGHLQVLQEIVVGRSLAHQMMDEPYIRQRDEIPAHPTENAPRDERSIPRTALEDGFPPLNLRQ